VPEDLAKAKITPKELDMAERLVEDMEMDWDPTKYHDTYRDDLLKLIEEKAAGKVRKAPKARKESSAEVIDFAAPAGAQPRRRQARQARGQGGGREGAPQAAASRHPRLEQPAPRSLTHKKERRHEDASAVAAGALGYCY
jgi:DNA end-binding protein Ku